MKPWSVFIAFVALLAVSAQVPAASKRMEDGRKAYETTCAQCHETGLSDAPQTRNAGDWENRSNLWDGVLFEHAEKGYLRMPARGGDAGVSKYDIDAAAEYMLTITHPQMPED